MRGLKPDVDNATCIEWAEVFWQHNTPTGDPAPEATNNNMSRHFINHLRDYCAAIRRTVEGPPAAQTAHAAAIATANAATIADFGEDDEIEPPEE